MSSLNILGNKLTQFNNNLWERGRLASLNIKSSRVRSLVIFSLVIAIIAVLTSTTLLTKEYIRGDYPILKQVSDGAVCMDGWRSGSQGPGTCSWHGGVDYYVYKKVEIGMHYVNTKPYLYILLISFSILIIPSILNGTFRQMAVSYSFGSLYLIAYIIRVILPLFLIFGIPFYFLYLIFKPKPR